jgi:transcriptional regulator with XRE-family HTH domain
MLVRNINCTVTTMPKNLALKIAIIESGLSQVDIAKAAELHESRLSQIVNGRREPTDAEQKVLARVLRRKAALLFPQSEAVAS